MARFGFRFGSHGQRFLLAVGFFVATATTTAKVSASGLFREKPTAHDYRKSALIVATVWLFGKTLRGE